MREDRKTLIYAMILTVGIIFVLTVSLVRQYIQESDYIEVEAIVKNVYTAYGATSRNPQKRVQYEFMYEGNNYTTSRQVIFSIFSKGKNIKIKCNPENPEELQDVYGKFTSVLILTVLLLVLILMIKTFLKENQ